jgi:hypothetical protein
VDSNTCGDGVEWKTSTVPEAKFSPIAGRNYFADSMFGT